MRQALAEVERLTIENANHRIDNVEENITEKLATRLQSSETQAKELQI